MPMMSDVITVTIATAPGETTSGTTNQNNHGSACQGMNRRPRRWIDPKPGQVEKRGAFTAISMFNSVGAASARLDGLEYRVQVIWRVWAKHVPQSLYYSFSCRSEPEIVKISSATQNGCEISSRA